MDKDLLAVVFFLGIYITIGTVIWIGRKIYRYVRRDELNEIHKVGGVSDRGLTSKRNLKNLVEKNQN